MNDEIKRLLTLPRDCYIDADHQAMKDPEHWCVGPTVLTRDSDLMSNVNYIRLVEALEEHGEWKEDWEIHVFNHWAVGWVKHLAFRVLDEKGEPTPLFHFVKKWFSDLEDYPCADDELLSEMEYDAAIEVIISHGSRWLKEPIPEEWASEVFTWLWQNDQSQLEDRDGNGPYPSEESVREAMRSLGLHEEEEAEA